MEELIKEVSKLVGEEYSWEERDTDDYGSLPDNAHDSFGSIDLRTHSEPEDAIWGRDMSDNFYEGLKVGIRNTIKVLREHPELLSK